MVLENMAIEAISKINTIGEIIPLRIRLEDEDHNRITANIIEIVYSKENNFAGINTFDYGCKVLIDEREQLLELRYHVALHKWKIRKVLY